MSYSVVYSVASKDVPGSAASKMVFVSLSNKADADRVAAALPLELKYLLGEEVEVEVEVQ
jgi:hypothetical protein